MVKLAYTLNTEGKGKIRKRTLEEVVAIIRDKDAYFANPNNQNPQRPYAKQAKYHSFSSFSLTYIF